MTNFITFTGAQGSGKTTMRKALVTYLHDKGLTTRQQYTGVLESVARDAKKLGFVINEKTNFETQYYIAHKYIVADMELRKEMEHVDVDFVILDRSPLDVIPYSNLSEGIDTYDKIKIANMLYSHCDKFKSTLIYCEPLAEIVKEDDRSDNVKFQQDIVAQFENMIVNLHDKYNRSIVKLDPYIEEERFKMLLKELNL